MKVSEGATRLLADLLTRRTGQELGEGRRWRIDAAVEGLMRARGLRNPEQLITEVVGRRDPGLDDEVMDALLNNETSFFRDKGAWDCLRDTVLPKLQAERRAERRLSIWCAGVSTGQEAWSLAMLIAGSPQAWDGWRIDILGTDVSPSAIARAGVGGYTQWEVGRGLPVRQLAAKFDKDGDMWRVAAPLRRGVRFDVRSVLDDPPAPGNFDLILCRNVLFYFPPATRGQALQKLADGLAPDGLLMLGAGETGIGGSGCIVADPVARGLYRRAPGRSRCA